MVRKYFATFMMFAMLAVGIPLMSATPVAAQTRYYNPRTRTYTVIKKPNFYRRHRKAINIGAATGIGMLVGGLLGGRKGVVIGGLAGAGGGALFTHKQRPKNYYRRYTYRRL
jgi:hypothetical protein